MLRKEPTEGLPGGTTRSIRLASAPSTTSLALAAPVPVALIAKDVEFGLRVKHDEGRHLALEAAEFAYSKRFIVLGDFWWDVVRHATWKKSFRAAIEVASSYSNVSEGVEEGPACQVDVSQITTAFWNAVSFSPFKTMAVGVVDEHLKTVFKYFDRHCAEKIDYRELLSALALFQVGIFDPVTRIVRTWCRAYDSDALGGVPAVLLETIMQTLSTDQESRWAMSRLVHFSTDKLVADSRTLRVGTTALLDTVTEYANTTRLAKRYGSGFGKKAGSSTAVPPSFVTVLWSPFDEKLAADERALPLVHIDVLCAWITKNKEVHALLQRLRLANTHPVYRGEWDTMEEVKRVAAEMRDM